MLLKGRAAHFPAELGLEQGLQQVAIMISERVVNQDDCDGSTPSDEIMQQFLAGDGMQAMHMVDACAMQSSLPIPGFYIIS